ncbi:hypothetical protein G7046_g51 [Stylonectria norvegica]|nr:hypothetical protein G7046_g51 [Stylonectria norvegica]
MDAMAANESQRLKTPLLDSETDSSPHRPLNQTGDSVRLIKIEPAVDNKPLSCTIVYANLGDRPEFEALSYMWGDENAKQAILLDDVGFAVGQNLWDALHYLRSRPDSAFFWIDALCINQDDIVERNFQMRTMSQIYFGASNVIVWLGRKYTSFSAAAHDGYWERVWTLQEIGQARRKEVCYGHGTRPMAWDEFIDRVSSLPVSCEGPLRLQRQLEARDKGAHTLRSLLEEHRNALCKDPRDRVYGLVGFAVDARGFRMDYSRSLMRVWTDTMHFMNYHGLFYKSDLDSDVLFCGRLVRELLMGNQPVPGRMFLQPFETHPPGFFIQDERWDTSHGEIFYLESCVLGIISSAGPSTTDVAASVSKVEQWAQRTQTNFKHDISAAITESDTLINAIFDSTEELLATHCTTHAGMFQWKFSNAYIKDLERQALPIHQGYADISDGQGKIGDVALFQLFTGSYPKSPWKMGITANMGQLGRYVCWIPGSVKAIVLDSDNSRSMIQMCGTALLTEDLGFQVRFAYLDQQNRQKYPLVYEDRLKYFSNSKERDEHLTLKLDAETIYFLLD